ncbi:hypothetical protein [Agrobacterium sp. RAC06]|uniref:hypothetical protein n=1 Tax=Agrobacterium sp. RAC06 TaxID=1842536 RepID=UPI00083D118F|nr:hypothetical protein [Agrobacterium sp. RAC06]AOG12125.1 hypothetical protein BSY240_1178 [Agrobacterium sp. RAC06]
MSWLEWSSSVIGSTAWPIALVIVALIFRGHINNLLKRVKGAKYGDAEVQFREDLDKIEAQVGDLPPAPEPATSNPELEAPSPPSPDQPSVAVPTDLLVPHIDIKPELMRVANQQQKFNELAKLSPSAAVLNAWRDVELELEQSFRNSGLPSQEPRRYAFETARQLHTFGVIDTPTMNIINDLRKLRNRAAHLEEVSITDAFRFETLARDVVKRLRDARAR